VREPAVADSTCLIGLERIGRLDLLQSLFEPILIPPKVHEEFGVTLEWLKVQTPSNQMLVNVLKFVVDEGKAEAITLALEKVGDSSSMTERRGYGQKDWGLRLLARRGFWFGRKGLVWSLP